MRPNYDEVRDFQRDAHGARPRKGTIRLMVLDAVCLVIMAIACLGIAALPVILAECDETTYTCTDH